MCGRTWRFTGKRQGAQPGRSPGPGGGAGGEAPLQVVPFLKVKRKPVKDSPQRNRLVRIVL